MNWWKKLLGQSDTQKNSASRVTGAPASPSQQADAGEPCVVAYNQGTVFFGKRDFHKAEELFLRAMTDSQMQSFRKVAVAAAGMSRLRRGSDLSDEMFPSDLRKDKNGCLVAFIAVNMTALLLQQGRSAKTRADSATWYVNVDISDSEYELQVMDFGGNTMGQAFRKDVSGKLLYLPELEQDPSKFNLRKPSDSSVLAFLRKNIKTETIEMAPLPATGLTSILSGDSSTPWPTEHKVKVIRYD